MLDNLKKAARDRETLHIGGGEFSPAEVKAFVETIEQLITTLQRAEKLGLTFDIGSAYIRRSYIDKQDELRKQISDLLERIK